MKDRSSPLWVNLLRKSAQVVNTPDGPETFVSYSYPSVDDLCIIELEGSYNVTHKPTGRSVFQVSFTQLEDALRYLLTTSTLCNWEPFRDHLDIPEDIMMQVGWLQHSWTEEATARALRDDGAIFFKRILKLIDLPTGTAKPQTFEDLGDLIEGALKERS